MTWVPFELFFVELHFELSHFEMNLDAQNFAEINGFDEVKPQQKHYLFRFVMHKHLKLEETLGIKLDANSSSHVHIAYPFSKSLLIKEFKDNKKNPEKSLTYYPGVRF